MVYISIFKLIIDFSYNKNIVNEQNIGVYYLFLMVYILNWLLIWVIIKIMVMNIRLEKFIVL